MLTIQYNTIQFNSIHFPNIVNITIHDLNSTRFIYICSFVFTFSISATKYSRRGTDSIDWYRNLPISLHGPLRKLIHFGEYFGKINCYEFVVNWWCRGADEKRIRITIKYSDRSTFHL